MSVVSAGGKLGISYYCSDTTVLYMMPDVAETDGYDLLKKGGHFPSICLVDCATAFKLDCICLCLHKF